MKGFFVLALVLFAGCAAHIGRVSDSVFEDSSHFDSWKKGR